MNNQTIILIGMPGSGKSTIGKRLAKELNQKFIDLDKYLSEKFHGKSIQSLVEEYGEEKFIQIEEQAIEEIDQTEKIIAPGGSLIFNDTLMSKLKKTATIIYLKDTIKNLKNKIPNPQKRGIIGMKEKTLDQIFKERTPRYEKHATLTISVPHKTIGKITQEILSTL